MHLRFFILIFNIKIIINYIYFIIIKFKKSFYFLFTLYRKKFNK